MHDSVSRRGFVKGAATVSAGLLLSSAGRNAAHAAGTEKLRVGVIGCGGRGTGAAINCLEASPIVEIAALGDLFQDRVDDALKKIEEAASPKEEKADAKGAKGKTQGKGGKKKPGNILGQVNVAKEKCFAGWDAFQKVVDSGVDMVILATPPHFRPQHFAAAIKAGKHVFTEKPVGVDPVAIRSFIASANLATEKKLNVVAGTQRRHQAPYLDVMKRIRDGAIGELVGGQCYWNQGGLWVKKKEEGWSDMEWQCRNWLYFTWLSGDHIVEQHVHNLDVINWAMDAVPVSAMGMGGRQVRVEPEYGNIFDHFAIEYVYPNGARVMSMCRQTAGASNRVAERVVGTKGSSDCCSYIQQAGAEEYKCKVEGINPYVQEHKDLIECIVNGTAINEGVRVAESTLTAIMGRMSAYTGREVSWKWVMNASKLDLCPEKYEFGPIAVPPVAVPGKDQLI